MDKTEENNVPYFKMDRTVVRQFNSFEESDSFDENWLRKTPRERLAVIEFLRMQWIELNDYPKQMDRSYFEYR